MPANSNTAGGSRAGRSRGQRDYGEESYELQWHNERREQQRIIEYIRGRSLATTSLDAFLTDAAAVAAEVLCADLAQILEYDPVTRGFRVRAGIGWRENADRDTLSAGDGAQMGYAYAAHGTVVVERLDQVAALRGPGRLRDHGVVSGASVLIAGQESPFGVLSVYTTGHRLFTPDDVEFLQSIASVTSAAVCRSASHPRAGFQQG